MTIRRCLLAGAAAGAIMLATAVSGPAKALDPADVPANWSGFHLGMHVGGGWAEIDPFRGKIAPGPTFEGSGDISGLIAGGSAGYDWQFRRLVFGVEASGSLSAIEGDIQGPFFLGTIDVPVDIDWFASVTGRAGFSFGQTLVYGRGGVAWVNEQYCPLGCAPEHTRSGWLAGIGVEHQFMPNWSAVLEYNHMDFGTDEFDGLEVGLEIDVVKFGVNYRFSGPLVPR